MSETNAFLEATTGRYRAAETALHNGDAAPRKAMWARTGPVTLLGAAMSGTGWDEIEPVFDRLQARFSNCTSCEHEVIAAGASGDLAYLVALEHTTASVEPLVGWRRVHPQRHRCWWTPGGPTTGDEVVPCSWRNSPQGGPMLLASDTRPSFLGDSGSS